jgi:hypothetical protein
MVKDSNDQLLISTNAFGWFKPRRSPTPAAGITTQTLAVALTNKSLGS